MRIDMWTSRRSQSAVSATPTIRRQLRDCQFLRVQPDRFADVMLHAIALNGSFFNTQRMLQEYLSKACLGHPVLADVVGA